MEGQSKKSLSVTLAIIAGVAIILFALKGDLLTNSSFFSKTATPQNHSALDVVAGTSTPKKRFAFWHDPNAPQDMSTSTSDILAHDLIANYATIKKTSGTSLDPLLIEAQGKALADKVDIPTGPTYQLSNLKLSSDNSPTAKALYQKEMGDILHTFGSSKNKEDLAIIFADPHTTSDTVKQTELAQNISGYKKLIKSMVALKTPSDLAPLHLKIIQTFSDLENSLQSAAAFYGDPIKELVALSRYRDAVENLTLLNNKPTKVVPPTI